jgi:hypothetical protein
MSPTGTTALGLAAAACLAVLVPALACADEYVYELILTNISDTGEIFEMPGLPYDLMTCKQLKKKIVIGEKLPPGLIIFADGSSPGFTRIAARCEAVLHKTSN